MGKRIKPKVGDVFTFTFNENTNCFGQIISNKSPSAKIYILFDFVSNEIPDLKEIINKPILAIAHLDDFSIMDGDWKVIGNTEVAIKNINYPNYLNGFNVVDYEGNILRSATPEDIQELDYRETSTSGIFVRIVKAKFVEDCIDKYKDYLFDSTKWIKTDIETESLSTNKNPNNNEYTFMDITESFMRKAGLNDDQIKARFENKEFMDLSKVLLNNLKLNRYQTIYDEKVIKKDEILITIRYKISDLGINITQNLEKRSKIEAILDNCLKEAGLGDCDGGEIGNGEMLVFCFVKDPEKAVDIIKEELKKHNLLTGAKITYNR